MAQRKRKKRTRFSVTTALELLMLIDNLSRPGIGIRTRIIDFPSQEGTTRAIDIDDVTYVLESVRNLDYAPLSDALPSWLPAHDRRSMQWFFEDAATHKKGGK